MNITPTPKVELSVYYGAREGRAASFPDHADAKRGDEVILASRPALCDTMKGFGFPRMANVILLGAQWGDEGKGKLVDYFSERFDIVVRYQGGHNAGHTVYLGDAKIVLKLIPSGVLRPGKVAVIGNGLVVDPAALIEEIDALKKHGVEVESRLRISNRAHVIFPFHRVVEKISESRPGRTAIGTTSRGIGPAYEDKIGRRGIRIADLTDGKNFGALLDALASDRQAVCAAFGLAEPADVQAIRQRYEALAARIRPMVCDAAEFLSRAIAENKSLLFEGAQGSMLDVDHGTYPFVTSSNATAGGACTGTGVPPTRIHGVIGVSKAYITRVGGGPFPTEDSGASGAALRDVGREFGAVTGRPRRCGWFDAPLLRYTAMVNGFDSVAVTKLDVLDQFDEIPVCVAYRCCGRLLESMPATIEQLERAEPVYEMAPGWRSPTSGVARYEDLPPQALAYLRRLEELTTVEIGCVSTGPGRAQTFVKPGSRLGSLTGWGSAAGPQS